jgi:phage replication O-like protein O
MPVGDRDSLKADLDDGYTKISNLILEALAMCKISSVQKGICLFLMRRTYGWGKTEDAISLKDFSLACGTSQPYISRQLKELLKKNIILRINYEPGKTPVYSFNTRVAQWDKGCINVQGLHECARQGLYECARVPLHECARVNQESTLEPSETEAPLKKELKKKKEIKIYTPDLNEFILSSFLLEKILDHLPSFKQPDMQKWAAHMDAVLRIDGRDPPEVKAVIIFAHVDPFWKNNILSVDKLRKQYDQLNAKRLSQARKVVNMDANRYKNDDYTG